MALFIPKDHPSTSSVSYFETYPRKKTQRLSSVDASVASSSSDPFYSSELSTQKPDSVGRNNFHHFSRPIPGPHIQNRLPSPDMDPSSNLRTPGLRYSGSSSATHYLDTPPRTPPSVFNIDVVSAPIPDVGTMDALVDGMNDFDRDDILYASSLHRLEQFTGSKISRDPSNIPNSSPGPLGHIPLNTIPPRRCSSVSSTRSRIPRPKPRKGSHSVNSKVFPSRCSLPTNDPSWISGVPSKSSCQVSTERDQVPVKTIIPSIHDIVRAHALDLTPTKTLDTRDSVDLISRSSIDTIAEEVQHTLRQPIPDPTTPNRSNGDQSSNSLPSPEKRQPYLSNESKESDLSTIPRSEAIATYIRSTRLTTLVKVPRPLRAPLQVSLSDLGDPSGRPLVVFLGLGAVRYIMGLYDEMAEILGLRIITIDRWGLGRTSQDPPNSKGVKEWARVVNDVLDRLGVQHCSILAHSAGAPYAMSFANLYPSRVKGDICLLAPWIGGSESSGYRWLKYVPNTLLKTAQAAEWRLQTWMLGKPPSMNYQGIGYTKWEPGVDTQHRLAHGMEITDGPSFDSQRQRQKKATSKSSSAKSDRSSILSNDYDDLADFEGCFESHSTLTTVPPSPVSPSGWPSEGESRRRRSSRGIFHALLPRTSGARRDSSASRPSSSNMSLPGPSAPKLKPLRSVGSLRGSTKSIAAPSIQSNVCLPSLPQIGLGFGGLEWQKTVITTTTGAAPPPPGSSSGQSCHSRSRRSVSLTAKSSNCISPLQCQNQSQPEMNMCNRAEVPETTLDYQASLANALVAASHSEASKGIHSDLLQILNHDGKSWGFVYGSYPHKLKVWYGDKDERIAEGAVRWMERSMGTERCEVKVVKNADHNLMYRTAVIVEVLEIICAFW